MSLCFLSGSLPHPWRAAADLFLLCFILRPPSFDFPFALGYARLAKAGEVRPLASNSDGPSPHPGVLESDSARRSGSPVLAFQIFLDCAAVDCFAGRRNLLSSL